MAEIVSINEYLLNEMKTINISLDVIKYDKNKNVISYKDKEIELKDFVLSEIYNKYSQLKADIEVMKPEDLFNIITVNVAVKEKSNLKSANNEESIEQIKTINPSISNIKLITKKDELGTEKQYVYIITSDGASHVLYDYYPKDVLNAFKMLAEKNGNSFEGITEKDLYDELKRSMDELNLIDSKDAISKDYLSDDFKNKMESMEKNSKSYINNDGTRVLGNAEHDIFIEQGNIVTFNTDSKGNIIRENHIGGNLNENGDSLSNQENNHIQQNKDELISIDITKLIDVSEYIKMIESPASLSKEEIDKKNFFEGFMSELYIYKSYLGSDALEMWNQYEQFIIISSTFENISEKMQESINFYNKLSENSKQIELKNAKHKALILNYQAELARKNAIKQTQAGVVNALLIVEITTFISIIIGAIIFIIFKA